MTPCSPSSASVISGSRINTRRPRWVPRTLTRARAAGRRGSGPQRACAYPTGRASGERLAGESGKRARGGGRGGGGPPPAGRGAARAGGGRPVECRARGGRSYRSACTERADLRLVVTKIGPHLLRLTAELGDRMTAG